MEICKHICFHKEEVPELCDYLRDNHIPFKEVSIVCSFDIFISNPHWEFISNYVQTHKLFCSSETLFSDDELRSAAWMTVRSQWRRGYPQPESNFQYETITYSREHWCSECSSGLVQIAPFRMLKPPKWGKRHFMELNWVGDEIFVDAIAKKVLQDVGITGMSFCEVRSKNGKEVLEGIEQLVVSSILEKGMIKDRSSIRDYSVCPQCNTKKYVPSGSGMLAFKKEIFEHSPDIVKTAEVFGDGHYIARIVLINQKVYRAIVDNHLERGLVFEPIELL